MRCQQRISVLWLVIVTAQTKIPTKMEAIKSLSFQKISKKFDTLMDEIAGFKFSQKYNLDLSLRLVVANFDQRLGAAQWAATLTVTVKSLWGRYFYFHDVFLHRHCHLLNGMMVIHHRCLHFHHRQRHCRHQLLLTNQKPPCFRLES